MTKQLGVLSYHSKGTLMSPGSTSLFNFEIFLYGCSKAINVHALQQPVLNQQK